jgi:hypothetical protein
MFKKLLNKTALLSSFLGIGIIIASAEVGFATTFYLQQKDDDGNIALSGQFIGDDNNNSSSLTLDELTSFDLSIYDNPTYVLSDFTDFLYSLDGSDFISFNAAKTETINDGIISSIDYYITVDSDSDTITSAGETTYFENGDVIIGDLFTSKPIRVRTSQIPEGNNVLALSLLGFFALFQKTLKSSSKS